MNMFVVLTFAIIWSTVEGLLLLRDKRNAKGSTQSDKMTRVLNFICTEGALLSALFMVIPSTNSLYINAPFLLPLGTVLAILGFTLRHVSIHILGEYFRTTVEIDGNQPIIQKGPYRFIRHPSYSGIILFFIGYGILSQNWLCFAASVLLPAIALMYRIHVEEIVLIDKFGKKYEDYRAKTKKLIPFIF